MEMELSIPPSLPLGIDEAAAAWRLIDERSPKSSIATSDLCKPGFWQLTKGELYLTELENCIIPFRPMDREKESGKDKDRSGRCREWLSVQKQIQTYSRNQDMTDRMLCKCWCYGLDHCLPLNSIIYINLAVFNCFQWHRLTLSHLL